MPKRFTDSEKWKKVWFSELSPIHKCLWFYILDSCSNAGIWEPNWKRAAFDIGGDLDVDEVKKAFQKQFIEIDGGRKWFIVDYVSFQHGRMNPNNPAHKGAFEELRRYSLVSPLLPDSALMLLRRGFEAPCKVLEKWRVN